MSKGSLATVFHDCRQLKSDWLIKQMIFKSVKGITNKFRMKWSPNYEKLFKD